MKLVQPVSEHRIQRLTRWSMLWLAQILSLLCAFESIPAWLQRALDRPLYNVGRFVLGLIWLRTMRVLPEQAKRRISRRYMLAGAWHRALRGSAMRKLLLRGDVLTRARALLAALCNLDGLIAKQAKRLKVGLSRRLGGFVREVRAAFAIVVVLCARRVADTS